MAVCCHGMARRGEPEVKPLDREYSTDRALKTRAGLNCRERYCRSSHRREVDLARLQRAGGEIHLIQTLHVWLPPACAFGAPWSLDIFPLPLGEGFKGEGQRSTHPIILLSPFRGRRYSAERLRGGAGCTGEPQAKADNRFAVLRFHLCTKRLFVFRLSPLRGFYPPVETKGGTRFRPLKRAPE